MRSYSGCLTCKGRKLKCDEAKPICGPCVKACRDCTYGERSIFRGPERRKQKRKAGLREKHSAVFEEDHTWVRVPDELTFVQVQDPYAHDSLTRLEETGAIANENADDNCSQFKNKRTNTGIQNGDTSICEASGEGSAQTATLRDVSTPDTPQHGDYSVYSARDKTEIDQNVIASHLLRHFKEGPGQWMDLFDTTAYFSSKVPVIAASKPLLKSAVCALAAKHLWHLYTIANDAKKRNSHALSLTSKNIWHYQAAKYYDQALGFLKTAIDLGTYIDKPAEKEEMLAAVAILCTYELMDAPGTAWRAHLSVLPLFNDESESMPAQSPVIIPRTAVKGPVFWSLARQDLLCAFISETQTRLDLKDVRFWQNAGLATDEYGVLLPFMPLSSTDIGNSGESEEVIKANELTWLLGKIANYLTAGDSLVPEDYVLPRGQRPQIGLTQEHLTDRWNTLMTELETWHDCLPSTFTATARTRAPSLDSFEQIWFDLPLCASTIQSYHQAMILLLVNKPQESTAIRSTVSARLRSYRHALKEAAYHAREICSISLASPTDSVRINSVQALFVAGQVFEDRHEQDTVLEILSGIETDLGWTTKYHVAKLIGDWARE